MASGLLHSLPQPVREYAPISGTSSPDSTTTTLVAQTHFEPPPYGSVERRKFVPRKSRDFGDGGEGCLEILPCLPPSCSVAKTGGADAAPAAHSGLVSAGLQ